MMQNNKVRINKGQRLMSSANQSDPLPASGRLRMEQALLGHILRHGPTTYVAISAAQLLVLFGLWSVYPHWILLAWCGAMQVVVFSHLLVCRKYGRQTLAPAHGRNLRRFFIANALINSSLWGALTWLLDGHWDVHAFFILLPVLGIFAGAMNLAAVLPVYFALVTPIVVQSLLVLLFSDAANPVLAGFFLIYYAGMIKFSIDLHKMLADNYRLQLELEETNSELLVQKQAAEKANIDKSRFLAAASHDLRQPLYAMELFLGALAKERDNAQRGYLLARLRSALDSMQQMFSALLDMSRFDAGVITPQPSHFSAAALLATLKLKFEAPSRKKGLTLRVHSRDVWLHSDPILIQRVLENYLANAIKYCDRGGVLLACRRRGRGYRFEVWDTGRGIRAADIETIFDAFHQLDNPERDRRKGVGLGLSIVHHIATLLDVPIAVRSRLDKGSVFSIDVPVGEAQPRGSLRAGSVEIETPAAFVDRVVWIVDDDEDIREGLQFQLESWGCVTRVFDGLEEVVAQLERAAERPQLLISDLRLRDEANGLVVVQAVRARCGETLPAIIITGDTGPRVLRETDRTGLPVLHKPVTEAVLRQAMAEALRSE